MDSLCPLHPYILSKYSIGGIRISFTQSDIAIQTSFPSRENNGNLILRSKSLHHGRSLSLPSGSHPAVSQFDENLSGECQEKWVEKILDDYSTILDACSTVKDLISLMKQDVQELLSAIRRKDMHGIQGYLTSRTKSKKVIQKSLKN
ncbi:hypothetical protein Sango_0874100 [Sesamum angolense]|uniref:Uncharacterized protein n=1 Tax=Sesamum angolense TaxID=2727404 RepID=A0AAE1WX51_9LAMI|nr:hypothetical protein Sango_0874100 [Sesamum angolense]